jgi:ribosomal protein L32
MSEVLSQEEIDQLIRPVLSQEEIDQLLTPIDSEWSRKPFTFEELEALLLNRQEPEKPYGLFQRDVTMCRMSDLRNSEELLADIERRNKEEGMGNYQIPNTSIKLINYSVCPKCGGVFSFKDLSAYYSKPKPDPLFKNQNEQSRKDTRVCCAECGEYFLPALIISDGTPKNEVQFLCRIQTMNALESFYKEKNLKKLSINTSNLLKRDNLTAVSNDVLLQDLAEKPTLIVNLLQYTPAPLTINLIEGSNVKKGDALYGAWL